MEVINFRLCLIDQRYLCTSRLERRYKGGTFEIHLIAMIVVIAFSHAASSFRRICVWKEAGLKHLLFDECAPGLISPCLIKASTYKYIPCVFHFYMEISFIFVLSASQI